MVRTAIADPPPHVVTATEARRVWRRVLVVRCCRLPQFRAAVETVAKAHPGVEVWALTNAASESDVRAAGVHHVILHRARRIGPLSIGLTCRRTLRSVEFDAVILPTMDATLRGSGNLLRLAAAINAPETAVSPAGASLHPVGRGRVRSLAIAETLRCPPSIVALCQMLRALATPRPRHRPQPARPRVLHIINSLGLGGAQTQCTELVNRTPPDRYDVSILALSDEPFSRDFARGDVSVTVLAPAITSSTPIDAIADHCRRHAYDIVHTWLPLPNMYGTAAARLAGVPRVIMSVRSGHPGHYPWCQWWFRLGHVMASRLADVVTVNASALVRDHARWALYPSDRIVVVPNGLDTAPVSSVHPAAHRERLRAQLKLPSDRTLVGIVGRLSEEKGHETFLRMVDHVRQRGHRLHAVVVGDGPRDTAVRNLAASLGLDSIVTFLGVRRDVPDVIASLDALVLSSRIEGFPNVVLEAAQLGVPVVSTDVGGVREIIGDDAAVFPVGDHVGGARVLERVLADLDGARRIAEATRQRCRERFNTDAMVANWLTLYRLQGAPR